MDKQVLSILENLKSNLNSTMSYLNNIPGALELNHTLINAVIDFEEYLKQVKINNKYKWLHGEDEKALMVNLVKRVNGEDELNFSLVPILLEGERDETTKTLLTNLRRVVSKRNLKFTKPEITSTLDGLNYKLSVTTNGENNINIDLNYFFNDSTYGYHPNSYVAHLTGQFTLKEFIYNNLLNFKIERSIIKDKNTIDLKLNEEIMDFIFKCIFKQFDFLWISLYSEAKNLEEEINQVASTLLAKLEDESVVIGDSKIRVYCTNITYCFEKRNISLPQLKHLKDSNEDILSLHDILDRLNILSEMPVNKLLYCIKENWVDDYVVDLNNLVTPIEE